MRYIDGFLVPVPAGQKEAYRAMAAQVAALFKEFGATRLVECWPDHRRHRVPGVIPLQKETRHASPSLSVL